uniref:Peptidase S1 domain-containing protein n=1 Tax=Rhodnius prolixus TaxID=13249 RepID=T1IFK3_RHOPR
MAGKAPKRGGLIPSLLKSTTDMLYVAAIIIPSKEDPTRRVCSGIFVHEYWVVTVASCFDGRKVRDRKAVVIFDVYDYTAETVNQASSVQVLLHPEYPGPAKANDIALIKLRLSNKVHVKEYNIAYRNRSDFVPALYWFSYPYLEDHNKCIALGFGNNIHSDTVLHLDIYDIGYERTGCACKQNNRSFLCGKLSYEQTPCFTYKGGPLICRGIIYGLGSAAHTCGTIDTLCSLRTYFSFTPFCPHFQWISKHVPKFEALCTRLMSSAPAKSLFIIHHLCFIIFILLYCLQLKHQIVTHVLSQKQLGTA